MAAVSRRRGAVLCPALPRRLPRSFILALALLSLAACAPLDAGGRFASPRPVAPRPLAPVGEVLLSTPAAPVELELGIAVFDQGLDQAAGDNPVFPSIRKAESLLLPVTLASMLKASGAVSIVRVVHSAQVQLPLLLEGKIRRADGAVLELAITLRGADAGLLLDRVYRDEAEVADYPVQSGKDPFDDVYRAIANDVQAALAALTPARRDALRRLALMRFAARLAPVTFSRFIDSDARGRYTLASFPADDDPMLRRLHRLRRQDQLFIDSVDEQYAELRDEVAQSYALWREYAFELQRYGQSYRAGAAERKSTARRGSYAAMQQVYASYRKVKIQEQDLRGLVEGFGGESLETVLEVDDGIVRLRGSVARRYEEWRRILARIYGLESGALP